MKVITEGKIPPPPKAWWVGHRAQCSHCTAVVEFEEGDKVHEVTERRPNGDSFIEIKCPTCECMIHCKRQVMRIASLTITKEDPQP